MTFYFYLQFLCQNGMCIPSVHVCDEKFDCSDKSDEMNCDKNVCSSEQFRCSNGRCILKSWQCDGDIDCPKGEDEPENICKDLTCDPSYFKCSNNKFVFLKVTVYII